MWGSSVRETLGGGTRRVGAGNVVRVLQKIVSATACMLAASFAPFHITRMQLMYPHAPQRANLSKAAYRDIPCRWHADSRRGHSWGAWSLEAPIPGPIKTLRSGRASYAERRRAGGKRRKRRGSGVMARQVRLRPRSWPRPTELVHYRGGKWGTRHQEWHSGAHAVFSEPLQSAHQQQAVEKMHSGGGLTRCRHQGSISCRSRRREDTFRAWRVRLTGAIRGCDTSLAPRVRRRHGHWWAWEPPRGLCAFLVERVCLWDAVRFSVTRLLRARAGWWTAEALGAIAAAVAGRWSEAARSLLAAEMPGGVGEAGEAAMAQMRDMDEGE